MAKIHNVENSDIVRIGYNNKTIEITVWILPGIPDETVILELGYGRVINRESDRNYIDKEVLGVNVLPLKNIKEHYSIGVEFSKTNRKQIVACTQDHHGLDFEKLASDEVEGRLPEIIRESNINDFIRLTLLF